MNRTQLTAIGTAGINFIVTALDQFNVINATPELISAMNGFLLPLILMFLGDKSDRIEQKTEETKQVAQRVEAAQPAVNGNG